MMANPYALREEEQVPMSEEEQVPMSATIIEPDA